MENELPVLEILCTSCKGSGHPENYPDIPCYTCSGRGHVATDAGRKVLDFVKRFWKEPQPSDE